MKKNNIIPAVLLITATYILLSIPGWQGIIPVVSQSDFNWSYAFNWILIKQLALFIFALLLIFFIVISTCITSALALSRLRQSLLVPVSFLCFLLLVLSVTQYAKEHYIWLEWSIISGSLDKSSDKIFDQVPLYLFIVLSASTLALNAINAHKVAALQALALFVLAIPILPADTLYEASESSEVNHTSKREFPDIILLGLDSVSLHQAQENADALPFLNSLLTQGHNYTHAFTPTARTFGAWHSILSGRYPASSNMRFNLTEFSEHEIADLLPADLKRLGYANIYAQDERRFNNINEEYGFDKTVGPTVGAIDFIAPLFSDHLFLAYFSNSLLGKWLLPSIYNNRVSSSTYNPDQFIQSILSATKTVSSNTPLFLANHFCLAHYPYRWASYRPQHNTNDENMLYRDSLSELDKQIANLFTGLHQQGRLDNAIIVILSDHGEGLGNDPALWINASVENFDGFLGVLRGHGNSLLSRDQNNVIVNIRQTSNVNTQQYSTPVSLVDIRPTLLTLLAQAPNPNIDGVSLPPAIQHEMPNRYLFMETGMMMDLPSPDADLTTLANEVRDKTKGYLVNKQGRLVISEGFIQENLPSKQFGVVYNEQLLLNSPIDDKQFLWINRDSQEWTKLSTQELLNSPKSHLLEKLNCYQAQNRECYIMQTQEHN